MSAEDLKALRNAAALPQKAFALEMGVPLRTYEDLETGRSPVRAIHLNAARWAVLVALSHDNLGIVSIPDGPKETILAAAANLAAPRIPKPPPG